MLEDVNVVWLGSIASLLAGLGTGVGALGVFLVRKLTPQLQDGMLSAAAGVMLAASFFSLLLPGIEYKLSSASDSRGRSGRRCSSAGCCWSAC